MLMKTTELRKLPAGALCNIVNILETDNDWKKVMSLIPRNPWSDCFEPKYNNYHIQQIEDHARASNRKCAEILLEEWGTSGRIRPTLLTLREVCTKAKIYRASDVISNMIQESPPPRPQDGPEAFVPYPEMSEIFTETERLDSMVQMRSQTVAEQPKTVGNRTTAEVVSDGMNLPNFEALDIVTQKDPQIPWQTSFPNLGSMLSTNTTGIDTEILSNQSLIEFPYKDLEKLTKRFADRKIYIPDPLGGPGKIAGKIGSGGFGEVYAGYHPDYGQVAVKRAQTHLMFDRKPEIALKVFNTEVRFLAQFKHKNIVPIIGYSKDGPALCIVCEYIDGGSLEDKLAAKILTEKQRLKIMIGTAEGLKYLHGSEKLDTKKENNEVYVVESDDNSKKNNFVHGDVKSANILLTRDFVPKLCDFGLGKQYESTCLTTSPMGTHAYMAPEGFTGTITQKTDIYSFGIVLLEMLTGKGPLVRQQRETINIKDFVEDSCPTNDIQNVLDPFIDRWTRGREIYALARKCLERQRKQRPTAEEVVGMLYVISGFERDTESTNLSA